MNLTKKNIVITSASRTPIGTLNGSLKNIESHDLGSIVVKDVIKKSKLKSSEIDELIMGQVLTNSTGQNPARQAAIKSEIPIEKTANIINQVCGSGLRSVVAGYQSIMSGDSTIVVAGGQESMSNAPHSINIRGGQKLDETKLVDTMVKDGLWDAFNNYHMGMTAENVASKWQITRKEQDNFAFLSQEKVKQHLKTQSDGDVFYNIQYSGIDLTGNRYILKSKEATTNKSDQDIVNMKFVTATFYFKDGTVLTVSSKTGIYNNNVFIINKPYTKLNYIVPMIGQVLKEL